MSDSDPPPMAEFLADVDVTKVNDDLSGLILSVRVLDRRIAASAMTGAQVVEAFAEMFPPADLFGPGICSFKAIHSSLRDWLLAKGATLERHRSGRIMMQLVGIYSDAEDKIAAEDIVNKIISAGRRASKAEDNAPGPVAASTSAPDTHSQYKIAQGISMRFKDKDSKFSGALGERWMDYVAEYQQVARDFGLSASQRKQYLHNLLRDDAKRFYLDRIDNDVSLYSEAVRLIEDEYNSIVRQNRVKNFLSSLRISGYTKEGMDELAALEKVYKIVTKLSSQVPSAYRGETHKIEFLRNATVGYDWATQPLSRVATHNLSFQQLYGELEFQLHLAREAKIANVRDKVSGRSAADQDESNVPGILYQGPSRYARSQKNLGSWRSSATGREPSDRQKFHPLTVMGCFNCDDPGHMINQCPKPVDLTKAAKRKMEYLSKKTGRTRNAHMVLFELCQQLEATQVDPICTHETGTADVHVTDIDDNVDDFDLFETLLSTNDDVQPIAVPQNSDAAEDFGILFQLAHSVDDPDLSIYLASRHSAMAEPKFHGACLDTGAQRSVVGRNQAVAYYRFMGLPLVLSGSSPNVYRFGSQKRVSVGKAKFRVPYAEGRHMHMELDVVDIDIPLLIGLDMLDKFKLVVDNVDNILRCKEPRWSVTIVRKFGHLYYEWPYEVMYTIPELKKIHRHFYHPQPQRLFNVLKQAKDPWHACNTGKAGTNHGCLRCLPKTAQRTWSFSRCNAARRSHL